MENQNRNSNNSKPKGNFQPKNNQNKTQTPRVKKVHVPTTATGNVAQEGQQKRPERRRRVSIDKNLEIVVVSNVIGRFFYENNRMAQIIDLHHIGDEEYVTVGDLRTILNSSRKTLEGFDLLITEVVDGSQELEDVLVFLGLDRRYDEFFSLTGSTDGIAKTSDLKSFLINTPIPKFEKIMKTIDPKLRSKIIESAVVLFKLKQFGDYNKMQIIESYVSDELFDDAKDTEVDSDIYI